MNLLNRITNLYIVWLVLTAIAAFIRPDLLAWFTGRWISAALMTVMLGMGFTLNVSDFQRLLRSPGLVTLGFLIQYTVMPLTAWAVARSLQLEASFVIGLILLGSCPGGTASNVITFLARGDVALSVAMTMASTLLAFLMTPFWVQFLAGQYVPVDALGLCLTTLQVVVLPVLIGAFCNWKFPRAVARISWLGPIVSVVALCLITGGVVAENADDLAGSALQLIVAVVLLHVIGFGAGYGIARALGTSRKAAVTVSIECGMQNGGMAAMLAKKHFASHPLAALPAVFSAVTQNVLGSLVAFWARRLPPDSDTPDWTQPGHSQAEGVDTPVEECVAESSTT